MSTFGLNAYRIFVLVLGFWTGSGIHDSLSNHFAWYADPVAWAQRPVLEGIINPWPFSTLLLLVATIVAAVVIWRYRGSGREQALIAIAGCALILMATLGYFVPQLGVMFGEGNALSDGELVARSRTWITLNAIRIVLLVGLSYTAIVGLGSIGAARDEPASA